MTKYAKLLDVKMKQDNFLENVDNITGVAKSQSSVATRSCTFTCSSTSH